MGFLIRLPASAGIGEYAKRILDGTASPTNSAGMYAAFGEFTGGAKWNGGFYVDANTGVRARNQILIYMDAMFSVRGVSPPPAPESA
jgi:hypothetical protein